MHPETCTFYPHHPQVTTNCVVTGTLFYLTNTVYHIMSAWLSYETKPTKRSPTHEWWGKKVNQSH